MMHASIFHITAGYISVHDFDQTTGTYVVALKTSIVCPVLEYCRTAWNPWMTVYIEKPKKVKKRYMKLRLEMVEHESLHTRAYVQDMAVTTSSYMANVELI